MLRRNDSNITSIASEEYGDSNPLIVEFDWNDSDVAKAIRVNTDYEYTDEAFYKEAVLQYDAICNKAKKSK